MLIYVSPEASCTVAHVLEFFKAQILKSPLYAKFPKSQTQVLYSQIFKRPLYLHI